MRVQVQRAASFATGASYRRESFNLPSPDLPPRESRVTSFKGEIVSPADSHTTEAVTTQEIGAAGAARA
jgi:hypothetical protein